MKIRLGHRSISSAVIKGSAASATAVSLLYSADALKLLSASPELMYFVAASCFASALSSDFSRTLESLGDPEGYSAAESIFVTCLAAAMAFLYYFVEGTYVAPVLLSLIGVSLLVAAYMDNVGSSSES